MRQPRPRALEVRNSRSADQLSAARSSSATFGPDSVRRSAATSVSIEDALRIPKASTAPNDQLPERVRLERAVLVGLLRGPLGERRPARSVVSSLTTGKTICRFRSAAPLLPANSARYLVTSQGHRRRPQQHSVDDYEGRARRSGATDSVASKTSSTRRIRWRSPGLGTTGASCADQGRRRSPRVDSGAP